jgi:deazaflavin-dependent oxidoreductase (nitroreductase family)
MTSWPKAITVTRYSHAGRLKYNLGQGFRQFLKTDFAVRHRPVADELKSMSNDAAPTRIHALRLGAQAVGALALGALAMGALAIGALAIGRLVIGRSRIRRLEIDELVVARLHVTESLTAPSTPAVENIGVKKQQSGHFNQPTTVDRAINKLFGLLVGLGLGLPHNYLLQVRGRKSGRVYSTPVDVLDRDGKRYLVAPRGYTQWVRNAIASGTVSLKKGRRSEEFGIRLLSDDEKPEILKSYLDRYKLTVQRYFPVPAGSPTEAFRPVTGKYPVFELIPQR